MRKKIEQVINGNFEYRMPGLILSCTEIRRTVKPGENEQGEIYLGTEDNRKLTGYASSTHRRCVLDSERFAGSTVHLLYGIDTAGLQPGEKFEGSIVLTTNVGEYQIPFSVEVEKEQLKGHTGELRTLEDFTKLAREDFREAFRLFTSESFRKHLAGNLPKEQALYLGMTRNPVTYQHLEEFLIAAGQKEPVHISLKETSVSFYQVKESMQEVIWLQRSGWGNIRLLVETEGDFLEETKKIITEEDFIGSTYGVEYLIRPEKLGHGRHYGRILIKSPYEILVYEVLASRESEAQVNIRIQEKKQKFLLLKNYMRFQLGQITEETYLEESFHTIARLKEVGCAYPEYQLYEAYLHQCRKEDEKAREILNQYQDKSFGRDDLELGGAYLYLCYRTGLTKRKDETCRKIRSFYQQKRDSFFLFRLLLQIDEEYEVTPSNAVFEMEELYALGCRSPFLYLEAWRIIEKEMTLLHRIGGLWTQVFLFAGKAGLLTEELSMRLAYLSGYEKRFSRSLYRALSLSYEAFPTDDTLDAICKQIMKGEPRRKEYFPWYARAVERGLRLTRLYEYYVETMNPGSQEALPQTLRMYFSYNNALSDKKKAFVYANIVRHKETDLSTYESYRQIIKEFAAEKLAEGRINEDYAVLYQEFMKEPEDQEQAEALGKVLFTCRLYCEDSKVRSVAVRHSQMKEEECYPCVEGVAYPRIYTKDAVVLFVDERQRRYVSTVDYNLHKLMDETELLPACMEMEVTEPGFLLSMCQDGTITEENLELYQCLEKQEAFSEDYRREIREKLLDYYAGKLEDDSIDRHLRRLDSEAYARVNKKILLEILIARGMYEQAYAVYCEYGGEGVASESLLKMASRMILQEEMEEEEELLSLADAVYRQGKYDEVILEYLLKYYQGPQEQMFRLWDSARGFQLDTYAYEEKLLQLCVFVEDYRPQGADVLKAYVEKLGKEKIIRAYLTFASYGNFMKSQKLQPFVRQCLQAAVLREWEMASVCHMALLQSYIEQKDWMENSWEPQLHSLLEEALSRGILLSCYRKLPRQLLAPWQLDDKVFVEYRGDPEAEVTLHYRLDTGLGQEAAYKSEPLKTCYPGVFSRTFTLFYGETLHYYFCESGENSSHKPAEKVIAMNRVDEECGNKYQLLNQMLAARRLGKEKEVIKRLKEFLRQENYVKEMYRIEKE